MESSKEERVRTYAHAWYEFRIANNRPGTAQDDWERGKHIVEREDEIENEQKDHLKVHGY